MLSNWVKKQWNYTPEKEPRKNKKRVSSKTEVQEEYIEPVVIEPISFEPPSLPDGLSEEAAVEAMGTVDEIVEQIRKLKRYNNIVIKFGRFIPNRKYWAVESNRKI